MLSVSVFTILAVFPMQVSYVADTLNYVISLTRSHINGKKQNKFHAISLYILTNIDVNSYLRTTYKIYITVKMAMEFFFFFNWWFWNFFGGCLDKLKRPKEISNHNWWIFNPAITIIKIIQAKEQYTLQFSNKRYETKICSWWPNTMLLVSHAMCQCFWGPINSTDRHKQHRIGVKSTEHKARMPEFEIFTSQPTCPSLDLGQVT